MVNTRILEQRLGWRSAEPGTDAQPPARGLSHAPMLQGRLSANLSAPNRARKIETQDLWDRLPVIAPDLARLEPYDDSAPDYARGTAVGVAMDQLRAQLLRVAQTEKWRRIGITSAERGAGRSFVTAALAASLARLDQVRILAVDADLEAPGLGDMLGVETQGGGVHDVVHGGGPEDALARIGDTLAVALNDTPVSGAAEMLHAPDAVLAWRAMIDFVAPDLVLLDLPPLLGNTVTAGLLPQVDAVILVADGLRSTARDVMECERVLEGRAPLLGIVLNKSEDADPRPRGRRAR